MEIEGFLGNKGVEFIKLEGKGDELREQWAEVFANHLTESLKSKIFFKDYYWHVFSYKKLSALEKQYAVDTFNKLRTSPIYIFAQREEDAFWIEDVKQVKAQDIEGIGEFIDDIYIVDQDFSWNYVYTHEEYCGPYFYKSP
ncbi:DUF4275 family protein [Bacillus suaedae]|uniref:DUF4275 family protein n=1 Tax=Halalkalibacter suaedae TaxID=2822140 RepID=A0A940X1F9_9BACI|nr:DUF4275 family protein [Bacillus suaedae]MBP3953079.1 DUF4275 family protein [Bacillus suaedae]